jgi:hypothetical protein
MHIFFCRNHVDGNIVLLTVKTDRKKHSLSINKIFLSGTDDRDNVLDLTVDNFPVNSVPTRKLRNRQENLITDRKILFPCRFISGSVFLSVDRQKN